MKTNRNLWMALSAALLLATPFIARSQQQIPAAINYQGRLTDTLGNPVSSGYFEIEFRIWDDAVQNGAGNLIWGRSFPLHVVTNGLFNILLTDDGGLITTPTTPTNTLLTAFGGEDRYLGLTITVSNGVTVGSPSEISPRQQLASAPFAVQAQTANNVVAGGITAEMLHSESVTTPKIADGTVTTPKLADNAVTTEKISNSAVTSAKLNIDGDFHLNNHNLFLRAGSDTNHGVGWFGSGKTFAGNPVDGPALFGYSGGILGTTLNGQKTALSWGSDQLVTVPGTLSVEGGSTSFGSLKSLTLGTAYTAPSDGFVTFHAYHGEAVFTLWDANGTLLLQDNYYYSTGGGDTAWFTMPVAKGEHFRWSGSAGSNVKYWWRSIGKNVGNPAQYNP